MFKSAFLILSEGLGREDKHRRRIAILLQEGQQRDLQTRQFIQGKTNLCEWLTWYITLFPDAVPVDTITCRPPRSALMALD